MSDGDLAVKFFILWRFLPICGVIFILSLMRRKRKKVIAMLIYYLQGPMNRATAPQKRQLFRDLKYAKGSLKILEIGAGAGANFQFYHSRTKVTCLEPNEEFKAYILQNGVKTGLSIENITMVRGYAENMDMLAADSFDAVVCTFVLCSVRSPSLVLQEVKRVLKPGGKFYFMEHIVSERRGWIYLMQTALNPVWRCISDSCNINRDTIAAAEQAGFSHKDINRFNGKFPFVFVVRPLCMGTLMK